MGEIESFFPLEFSLAATPISQQASAKSKLRWSEQIKKVAREAVSRSVELSWLDERPLSVSIFYFAPAPIEGDIDNIVKPILDALKGVTYMDDNVVERIISQKFEPDMDWSIEQPSSHLATALDTDFPVLYVRIDDDCHWRKL